MAQFEVTIMEEVYTTMLVDIEISPEDADRRDDILRENAHYRLDSGEKPIDREAYAMDYVEVKEV